MSKTERGNVTILLAKYLKGGVNIFVCASLNSLDNPCARQRLKESDIDYRKALYLKMFTTTCLTKIQVLNPLYDIRKSSCNC